MIYLIISALFLRVSNVHGYFYPVTQEARTVFEKIVATAKKLCSYSCWVGWFGSNELLEEEPSIIDAWMIWLGLKNKPVKEEYDDGYYFCTAFALIVCTIVYTIYMTIARNMGTEKDPPSPLIPLLMEEFVDDSDIDFDGSFTSSKPHSRCNCPCAACMNESGDMK